MADEARARANVPRQGPKQSTNGMDSYHRYVAESTMPPPSQMLPPQPPRGAVLARPYTGHSRSFSTPRPSTLDRSSSSGSGSSDEDSDVLANLPRGRTLMVPENAVPDITVTSPGKPPRAPRYSLTPRRSNFPPSVQMLSVPGVRPMQTLQQPLVLPPIRQMQPQQPVWIPMPPTTADSDDLKKRDGLMDVPLPWRPFYLQRRILSSFAILFAGLTITVEAVLDLSNKRGGLGSPDHGFRYLWQYGSAFIFTCIAALWARPEYQAKSTAPWIRMAKGPASVDRTLMLDYVTMFEPWAVIKALMNRDWLVAATACIGFTLKLIIVIAVALVSPTFQIVTARGTSMNLQNAFINDAEGLRASGALPFFTMVGLQTKGLEFPDGTAKEFAFQSFSASVPATAELRADVEGFQSDMDCEPGTLNLTGVQFIQASDTQLNVTVSTPTCFLRQEIPNMALLGFTLPTFFTAFQAGSCGNTQSPDDGRLVVMVGNITIDGSTVPTDSDTFNVPISGAVSRSAALVCRPRYALTTVSVSKNNTQLIKIERTRSATNRTLNLVQPWDIVQGHFASYPTDSQILGAMPSVNSRYPGVAIVASDAVMNSAIAMEVKDNGIPPIDSLLQTDNLTRIATSYWRQYTALVARNALMAETVAPLPQTRGTAVIIGERLNVRPIPAHLLSGLLGFALVLSLVALAFAPKKGFLPRDPGTIINAATLLAHSRQLLQCLRGAGARDAATVKDKLRGSSYYTGVEPYEKASNSGLGYFKIFGGNPPPTNAPTEFVKTSGWGHPFPLHPMSRLAAVAAMAGMIISLEVVLRLSDARKGITTVTADTDRHFLWTTGPGVIFGLVALYLAAADCATRCLAPYATLRRGGSFETTVALEFMDKSKPRILYDAVRTRNVAVVVTTTAVVVASLLATFSGALYTTVPIPSTSPVALQTVDSFVNATAPCPTCTTDTLLASLILDANLTFPSFTFEDLNFPSLQLTTPLSMKDGAGTILVELPALRSRLDCRLYPQSEINTNFTVPGLPTNNFASGMRVNIAGEPCLDPSIRSNAVLPPGTTPSSVFGVATPRSPTSSQCSDFTYVWGQLAETAPAQVGYISAMGCNETLETVMAMVRLTGSSLHVDPTWKPIVQESTARPAALNLLPLQYGLLANLTTGNQLDPFFSSLVTSRFAIPAGNLGDPGLEKSGRVADAIVQQHRIVRAQNINVNSRRRVPDISAQAPIPAMLEATDATSLRRLVQDNVSTRVIQSILGMLLVLTLVAWLATPGTDMILPRSPCSVGSVAALLADGNVFGFLGRGAEWMATEEVERSFLDGSRAMGFKMGWEKVKRRRGEEGRGEKAFGISVLRGGGWGGGEDVGLGILARVNRAQRGFVRGWGKE